jgi:hypothetical protein
LRLFKKKVKYSEIKKTEKMKRFFILSLFAGFLMTGTQTTNAQAKTYEVRSFDEIIVSPHIEVVFEKADRESVVIENIDVPLEKLNVEVKGRTLHVYLDDAKVYTKSKKVQYDDYKGKQAIYDGTVVSARIYYKDIELVSLRGDEKHKLNSTLEGEKFKMNLYGEPEVIVSAIDLDEFRATLYGEAYLEVKEGRASSQKIVSYGESEVNTLGVNNRSAKVTAYGEGRVSLAVSDELKVTAYGEASVHYKGNPDVNKGIVIGEARIHRMN